MWHMKKEPAFTSQIFDPVLLRATGHISNLNPQDRISRAHAPAFRQSWGNNLNLNALRKSNSMTFICVKYNTASHVIFLVMRLDCHLKKNIYIFPTILPGSFYQVRTLGVPAGSTQLIFYGPIHLGLKVVCLWHCLSLEPWIPWGACLLSQGPGWKEWWVLFSLRKHLELFGFNSEGGDF